MDIKHIKLERALATHLLLEYIMQHSDVTEEEIHDDMQANGEYELTALREER